MKPFYLEALYTAEHNELVISANDIALIALCRQILQLLETQAPGAHIHLDEVHGLEGNVGSVIIAKREV